MKKLDIDLIEEQFRIFERPSADLSRQMLDYIKKLEEDKEELACCIQDLLEDYWYLLRIAEEPGKLFKSEATQFYNKFERLNKQLYYEKFENKYKEEK